MEGDRMSRNELQVLLNEPIVVVIGTAKAPRRVEVKEPTNAELGEYLTIINVSLMELLRANAPLITAVFAGKDTSTINADPAAIADIVTKLVAKIVGESEDFVRNEMSAKQSVAITRAFLDVLGWEFIRESFLQATRAWGRVSTPQSKSDVAPPWPVESSPTSAGRSHN
jgi:hypothetical protein